MRPAELTDYQIRLIEESFAEAAPRGPALAARFHQRLIHNFPQAKELLADYDDDVAQERLFSALALWVQNLRTPKRLQPVLEEWADFHRGRHLDRALHWAVGSTLLRTLAEFTGDLWGSEIEEAWSAACTDLSRRLLATAKLAAV